MRRAPGTFAAILLILLGVARVGLAQAESGEQKTNSIPAASVLVVVGAAGETEYGEEFARAAGLWKTAAERGNARCVGVGMDSAQTNDLEQISAFLESETKEGETPLWIVLLGHGTFDGKDAKFNLRGPDLSSGQLVEWLKPIRREIILVNAFSASGAFLKPLAAPGRVVIAATKSGFEQNYARFGGYLAQAIAGVEADLDKDGQTSLLEAFVMAARRVDEFYRDEGRLVTEHALMDDNGDGLGTPADWFRGVRAVKKPAGGGAVDGVKAHQVCLVPNAEERTLSPAARRERDALEKELAALREKKSTMTSEAYYGAVENILRKLSVIYLGPATSSKAETEPKVAQ
jgi:hypothetical protein